MLSAYSTIVAPTDQRKNGYTIWNCMCDCGGFIELDTRTLQRGTVRDCGCETKVKPGQKDLTGQRFGRLVCLKPSEERDGQGGVHSGFANVTVAGNALRLRTSFYAVIKRAAAV